LVKSGHKVSIVGGHPGDALAKCVDDYIDLDYSDISRMEQLVSERGFDYLVPGCNDVSYNVCAELNKKGTFPGIDSSENADTINNKEKFRNFSRQHGLPTPQVLERHAFGTRWPVIVKPVDAFSGRGVSIIRESNKDQFEAALFYACQASKTGVCIVEDYVEGQLFSHTAFIQSGHIVIDHIVEEHGTANPFVVDTSRVVYNFSEVMLQKIRSCIELFANKLGLKDGLIHTQFISSGEEFWLIEVTRRCPGDLYSRLIELSTGLNYAENYARPFLGLPVNFDKNKKQRWIMRHTLTQPIECILGSLEFAMPIKLAMWVPTAKTGDKLGASSFGRVAIMFAEERSELELDLTFEATLKRQLYRVEP
jgi:formate-dependent phosphoribosylglycinamide formyltransferase (GAR transformylase)